MYPSSRKLILRSEYNIQPQAKFKTQNGDRIHPVFSFCYCCLWIQWHTKSQSNIEVLQFSFCLLWSPGVVILQWPGEEKGCLTIRRVIWEVLIRFLAGAGAEKCIMEHPKLLIITAGKKLAFSVGESQVHPVRIKLQFLKNTSVHSPEKCSYRLFWM